MQMTDKATQTKISALAIVAFAFSVILVPELRAQWETEFVDSTGDVGHKPSIALDTMGNPHVSYRDFTTASTLMYAHWDGSEWQTAELDSTVYGYTSIALDNNGNPHIAFHKYFNEGEQLWHAWWDGASWQEEAIDGEDLTCIGEYNSLAFDTDGYPHIAYTAQYDWGGTDWCHVRHAYEDAAGWHIAVVDTGDAGSFSHVSLAVSSTNQLHISYYAPEYDLKYAHYDGANWSFEKVDTLDQVGSYSSIALDSIGYPHIAYHDHTNSGVKYARWDGSEWQIETVESDLGYGFYTSLALDADDRPHISSGEYEGPLRFAYWDGWDWQIEVVDTDAQCAPTTSLAVDDNGYCHIVYHDDADIGESNLKYAKRAPTTGVEDQHADPSGFTLAVSQNPFGEAVTITVDADPIPEQLTVHDVSGRLMQSLDDASGGDTFLWDGTDLSGVEAPVGTYIIRGTSEGRLASVRVVKL